MAINNLPAQMIKWQVEEWIRDYKFMLREIARLNRILNKSECRKQKLTATYGYEAAMPKGSKGISQAELNQLDRMEKRLLKSQTIFSSRGKQRKRTLEISIASSV